MIRFFRRRAGSTATSKKLSVMVNDDVVVKNN
jgi:hypothetical protein